MAKEKKDEFGELGADVQETKIGLQVFDINDIENIVVSRGGGTSGIGQEIRKVLQAEMADKQPGEGCLVRALVAQVRANLVANGEEDPGYQPVCTRMRNATQTSKVYRLVTNAHKVSFIFKR